MTTSTLSYPQPHHLSNLLKYILYTHSLTYDTSQHTLSHPF